MSFYRFVFTGRTIIRTLVKPKYICYSSIGITILNVDVKDNFTTSNIPSVKDKNNSIHKSKAELSPIKWKVWHVIKLSARYIGLFILFCPILLSYPLSRVNGKLNRIWWNVLLYSFNVSGPVFIKLGQWASTRRDLFADEVCDNLAVLQHRAKPHTWDFTCQQLKSSFGNEWNKVLPKFESEQPVGSGCVAQVYKAYMKYTNMPIKTMENIKSAYGKDIIQYYKKAQLNPNSGNVKDNKYVAVAVKVLHPGIHKRFQEDLSVLMKLAETVEWIFPFLKWLNLVGCVQEFGHFMISQVDLEREAKMLDKFSKNFKHISTVKFPQPIWPYITREVLIETWEDGVPLSSIISATSQNDNKKLKQQIADLGVNAVLKMVFHDNLVHSDLHPGNILIQKLPLPGKQNPVRLVDILDLVLINTIPKVKDQLKIVILDCGLVSSLLPEDFVKFCDVFKAVVLGKGEEVGDLFLKFSINECKDPEKFKAQMNEIVTTARNNTISLKTIDVGVLLSKVFNLLTTHHIRLESNFISVMIAILVMEGMGRSLDPNLDLMDYATNFLFT